jgi:hypothetical protein
MGLEWMDPVKVNKSDAEEEEIHLRRAISAAKATPCDSNQAPGGGR